ncbi:hypothetical protein OK016_25800 [Vibrio chagasii]|nr:hypothetical protein [Vibrio chagasii]
MEWKAYVAAKGTGDYQLARSRAFGDYPEPSALLEVSTCDHTANESGFCNPEYDELLQQASKTGRSDNRGFVFIPACRVDIKRILRSYASISLQRYLD